MHFPNTTAILKELQEDSRISLDQVMRLIEKLFADVQYQTGELVEDCRIDDMNQLVPTLSAVTNDIVYIFRNHEQEITDAQHKYFNSLTKAQSACAACLEQLQKAKGTIASLKAEEAQLLQRKQEAELLQKSTGELTQRVQALQAQIDRLTPADGSSDAGKLQLEITRLEEKLDTLKAQYTQDQARSAELQRQIDSQQAEIAQSKTQLAQQAQTVSQLDKQLQEQKATEECQNQTIAQKQKQVREGAEQQKAKTHQLERIQAVINQHTAALAKQDADLAELSSKEASTAQEVTRNQEQLDALKQRLDSKEKLLADHRHEYQTVQARLKHAQDSLQQTQADISAIQQSIQAAEQALSEGKTQADALKTSLLNTKSDVEYQKQDNENYRKEFLEPALAQLEALKAQHIEDEKRNQELGAELKHKKEIRESLVAVNSDLENNILHLESKLPDLEKTRQQNEEKLSTLQNAVSKKNNEIKMLMDTQNKLSELLNGRDSDQMRKDLDTENQKLRDRIHEADELDDQIRQVQAELKTAEDRGAQSRQKLDSLLAEQKALQDTLDQITAQLDQANSPENLARITSLQNRLNFLKALADKLSNGSIHACGDQFFLDEQICDSLDDAESTVITIRQAICDYAQSRQAALEAKD